MHLLTTTTLSLGFFFMAATAALRPAPPDPMIRTSQVAMGPTPAAAARAFSMPLMFTVSALMVMQADCRNFLRVNCCVIRVSSMMVMGCHERQRFCRWPQDSNAD